jgi:hypothetical protein
MMRVVYAGNTCIGFLLERGRRGVEAFDADERSLGIFPSHHEAAEAVMTAVKGPT